MNPLDFIVGADPDTLSPELLRIRGEVIKYRRLQAKRIEKRSAALEAAKTPVAQNRKMRRTAKHRAVAK